MFNVQSCDLDRAQQTKMATGIDELFLFGEEFESILDILEDDEELKDKFPNQSPLLTLLART